MNYCLILCEIHVEMKYLNLKVEKLVATIKKNLKELRV
jgi:hypothetical protein